MGISRAVLCSFLSDSLKMSEDASQKIEQLQSDRVATITKASVIQLLYQLVHAQKGTALMVEKAKGVVEILSGVEKELLSKPAVMLAQNMEWLPGVKQKLSRTHQVLVELDERLRISEGGEPNNDNGFLVRTDVNGKNGLLWFPISAVLKIVELQGSSPLCFGGRWLPVINENAASESRFGLIIEAEMGRVVFPVKEVVNLVGWPEASHQGALTGLQAVFSEKNQLAA